MTTRDVQCIQTQAHLF